MSIQLMTQLLRYCDKHQSALQIHRRGNQSTPVASKSMVVWVLSSLKSILEMIG